MKAIVQRALQGSVEVEGKIVGQIGKGLVVSAIFCFHIPQHYSMLYLT